MHHRHHHHHQHHQHPHHNLQCQQHIYHICYHIWYNSLFTLKYSLTFYSTLNFFDVIILKYLVYAVDMTI